MCSADFRYWHKADVQTALMNVRFEGNNGHDVDVTRCLLMTHSGHPTAVPQQIYLCRLGIATFCSTGTFDVSQSAVRSMQHSPAKVREPFLPRHRLSRSFLP